MSENSAPAKTRKRGRLLTPAAVVLVLLAAGLGTWHMLSPHNSPLDYFLLPETLPAIPRAHRPQTLDPALFTGDVAEAYRVARDHPDLLEQMPCYCGCYFKQGHQNLLDCFRDRHPATCPICVATALRAAKLQKAGYGIADIKRLIDRQYAKRSR